MLLSFFQIKKNRIFTSDCYNLLNINLTNYGTSHNGYLIENVEHSNEINSMNRMVNF